MAREIYKTYSHSLLVRIELYLMSAISFFSIFCNLDYLVNIGV